MISNTIPIRTPIARLDAVTMRYGNVHALSDFNLALHPGEAISVLGPNGAGKTTALKLLTGLKRSQKGRVELFGGNPRTPRFRRRIGVTPQDSTFPHGLKVRELLTFSRTHYPEPAGLAAIVEAFDLTPLLDRMAITLSGGQQRKLAVALAFCGAPDLVFLDEPTTGVDMESRQRIWDYVQDYKSHGGSVFLTTHDLEEAEIIADRIVLMNAGRIVREGPVAHIRAAVNVRLLRFDAEMAPALPAARLSTSNAGRHTYLSTDADASVRALVESGTPFSQLEVQSASLESAVTELLAQPAPDGDRS